MQIIPADQVRKMLTPFNSGYRFEHAGQIRYMTDDSKSPVTRVQAEAILVKLAAKIPLNWLMVPIYLLPYTLRQWDKVWGQSYVAEVFATHVIIGAGCDEATFVHELGHCFAYRFLDADPLDGWDEPKYAEYKSLRGVVGNDEHGWYYRRPSETFAEDFRYLLGFGPWEFTEVSPPEPKILEWIMGFVKGGKIMPEKQAFSDIKGHWAEKDIVKVKDLGLMSGNPDGTFKPDKPVTRAELATVLVKLAQKG